MGEYYPDKWVKIKVTPKDEEPVYKILAGWHGGFADGGAWQINSGIVRVTEDCEGVYRFYGQSGSVYVCKKQAEGMTMLMQSVFDSRKQGLEEEGLGTMEVVDAH